VSRSPVNFTKLRQAWEETAETAGLSAGVTLGGDKDLIRAAQDHFAAGGTTPAIWSRPLAELSQISSVAGELLVVFVPAAEEVEALAALEGAKPAGGVVLAVDERESATGKLSHPHKWCVRVSFHDGARGWRRLFEACTELAGEHVVALGRRYAALRSMAARRVIYRAAAQNALIGATFFVPGTDMPAMTLNQAKMVLSLAGIYGAEIGKDRALELVGVAGVGFGLRTLARAFLRGTPGVGWVIKASTGFTGTVALGFVAKRYFEMEAPAGTSKVQALVGKLKR